jgi:Oxidoreductase molybdopterin binding domain
VLNAGPLVAQQIIVQPEAGKQVVLSQRDLEALPRVQVNVDSSSGRAMFTQGHGPERAGKSGRWFWRILERQAAGLLSHGRDGRRVPRSDALPELDPAFTSKQVLLAFLRNGAPLGAKEGPYRIIVPDEKRMARWVKQVTMLKIVDVP